jgi:alkylation response protein AidB-like acyl-CoA dehydrogenase
LTIAMAGLDGGQPNIGACSIGGAQEALDKALAHMKERRAFGDRPDEFQALQMSGGYGCLADHGVEKIVPDLRMRQILEGTNEIMRMIGARETVGRA